ncbi:MAG: phosphatase PAP2 family protein [Chloroflexi bacterium]|nr:phosphatase PAP2 family protein [Chloroflexota bacterium]
MAALAVYAAALAYLVLPAQAHEVMPWDMTVLRAATQARSPWLDAVMSVVTAFGAVSTVSVLWALLLGLRPRLGGWRAWILSGWPLVANLAVLTLKALFERLGPPGEMVRLPLYVEPLIVLESWLKLGLAGLMGSAFQTAPAYAFPSGHAYLSTAFFGWLALVIVRRQTPHAVLGVLGLATLAALVGVSRVYFAVHWPSDVLASWLLATGSLILVAWLTHPPASRSG